MSLRTKKQSGVTLLEILVALSIFIIASSAVVVFIRQGFQVQNFSLEQTIAISEAKRGVETMVREIRETQIADTGAYPITEADDQQYIFYSDIDKDNAVERVRYFLDGTDFKKGTIEPQTNPVQYVEADEVVVTLSQYVRNGTDPIFTYYNGDWPTDSINNPLSTPAAVADVRLVSMSLSINVRPSSAPSDFVLKSDVHIRNLKDNL
jgi:prepilin-type N-terminal cleavage/methylation domain-containing protein